MAELALDHVERDALAGELDGVGVAQLVRREAAPDAGLGGEPAELDARVRARPGPPAGRAVDDAEQRPDWGSTRAVRPLRVEAEGGRKTAPPAAAGYGRREKL